MEKRKKILLTGAAGTIGRILYMHLGPWHDVYTPSRQELDLTNRLSVVEYYSKHDYFDVVIHCAVRGADDVYSTNHSITTANLQMYFNLVDYDNYYGKFINIGSGAEIGSVPADVSHKILVEETITSSIPELPYGLSKNVIARDIANRGGQVYNLRLWGIIAQTRIFQRLWDVYNNGEKEFIIQLDRYMDYISEDDLVKIIKHYVTSTEQLPKDLNMVYLDKYKVSEVIKRYIEDNGIDIDVKVTGETKFNYFGSGAKLFQLGILK